MNIGIFGANGMLGHAVCAYLTEYCSCNDNIIPFTRKDYDIAREYPYTLPDLIAHVDAVVNCAGIVKGIIDQHSIGDVVRVNTMFPKKLAMLCKARSIRCYHISTDCVYSGTKGNYNELDPVDATDIYGMSKIGGEAIEAVVLRTSFIGEELPGTEKQLLEWARKNKGNTIFGYTNHKWNGVTTVALAEIIHRLLVADDGYKPGLIHIHSPNTVTKYELLCLINEVYRLDLDIQPIDIIPVGACDRSLSSIYHYGEHLPEIGAQLERQLEWSRNRYLFAHSNPS